mmetsp:Transcript_30562/g.74563  ORF Transcript_30562/g.74563 Transcript_30562/m.74563 type:complete len:198 (+) Transcript_30562:1214-1807(+)
MPRAVVVAGPSGVGKGTLIGRLGKEFEALVGFSVSHTTRAPRKGEIDGVAYNFTDVEAMKKEIEEGKFVEWAEVHGRYYGTSFDAVKRVADEGQICVLDIDVQGCRSVRKAGLPALFVFVAPPSFEELEKRLRGRASETEDAIATRLQNAKGELEAANEPGLFDHKIVNDDLDAAYAAFKGLLAQDLEEARSALHGE